MYLAKPHAGRQEAAEAENQREENEVSTTSSERCVRRQEKSLDTNTCLAQFLPQLMRKLEGSGIHRSKLVYKTMMAFHDAQHAIECGLKSMSRAWLGK